jgi:hypothetical protein
MVEVVWRSKVDVFCEIIFRTQRCCGGSTFWLFSGLDSYHIGRNHTDSSGSRFALSKLVALVQQKHNMVNDLHLQRIKPESSKISNSAERILPSVLPFWLASQHLQRCARPRPASITGNTWCINADHLHRNWALKKVAGPMIFCLKLSFVVRVG